MALDNYVDLQASIIDWANNTTITNVVTDLIAMAEAQMTRRFVKDGPVSGMMGRSDATINAEFISVPTDFYGVKAFSLTPLYYPLQFVEPEKIVSQKALYPLIQGDPQLFSVVGSQFQFWPWSGASTYTAEISYWKRIPALSNTNPTNWLLASNPDAYLYGALAQSAPYLIDDDRLPMWLSIYQTVLDDIIEADKLVRLAPQMSATLIPGGIWDGMKQYW